MIEEKDGAPETEAPEAPAHTPLSELVDKPRFSEPSKVADEPRRQEPREKREKPAKPDPGYVPLREVLDERERRQKAEQDAQRYRAAWEEHQRKLAAEQDNDPAPDMFKDPNAYNAWVDRQLDRRAKSIANQHIEPLKAQLSDYAIGMSEMRAKSILGDKFKPFEDWLKKQPDEFKDWCMQNEDPYAVAFQQYRTRTTFERLGSDDLDTFLEKQKQAWLAEQRGPVDPSDGFEDEPAPQRQQAPRSFAGGRSADPAREGQKWSGPKPLAQIDAEKNNRKRR